MPHTLVRPTSIKSPVKVKNGFVQRHTGFSTSWLLISCLLTAGSFALFSVGNFYFLKKDGQFDMPLTSGERFWYLEMGRHRWLTQWHLWCVARELKVPLCLGSGGEESVEQLRRDNLLQ